LQAAREAPRVAPHLPNAILLDTGTDLWWSLARWIEGRARYRAKNIDLLAKDPDAELDIGRDLWNDAAERWRNIVEPLRTWNGIAIITARGGWVSGTDRAGQPTRTKEWSTNAHKSLPFDASLIVRLDHGREASIVAARSLTLNVPQGGAIPLDPGWRLADVVFDKLGLNGATTGGRVMVQMTEDWPVPMGKLRLREAYERAGYDLDAATTEAREAWNAARLPNGKVESVDPAKVTALIEAVEGPVAPQGPPEPVLVPEPTESAPTDHTGPLSAPVGDGQEPDPPTDDHPADVPPPPGDDEQTRIEGIRAWVDALQKPEVIEALGEDADVSGSVTSLRKRLREALAATTFVAPPVVQDPPASLREAWARHVATLDSGTARATALSLGMSVEHVEHLTGPETARLVGRLVDIGAWPPTPMLGGE
jgi:hypothetical protein